MAATARQFGNSIFGDVYSPRITAATDAETRRQRCATIANEVFDALTALDRYTSGQDVNKTESEAVTNLRNSILGLMPTYEARGVSQEVMDGMARLVVDLSLEGQVEFGTVDANDQNPLFWSSRVVGVVYDRASVEFANTFPKQKPCVYY